MTDDVLTQLGAAAAKVVADAWSVAMLALWDAGLFLTRIVLHLSEVLTTPDVSSHGPAGTVYRTTFWMSGVLVLVMALVQMGVSLLRRDGKSLGRLLIGSGQFAVVWAAWVGYCASVLAACGAINTSLRQTLLGRPVTDGFPDRSVLQAGTDTTVATVLGLLGVLLWLAAIAHLVVMVTRAGALLVLVATGPIAAAGLVSDVGQAWFWKCVRWFHAAAFAPILMTLVMGIGVKLSTGVAQGLAAGADRSIGTALPGVLLIAIAAIAPMALFKLLAFVDPGTTSGASLRAGLAAQGGLANLVAGNRTGSISAGAADDGSSTWSTSGLDTTSGTDNRIADGVSYLGIVGQGLAAGLRGFAAVGATGAAVMVDTTNQMGVGSNVYHPDLPPGQRTSRMPAPDQIGLQPSQPDHPTTGQGDAAPAPMTPPRPPSTGPGSASGVSSSAAGGPGPAVAAGGAVGGVTTVAVL